MADIKLICRHCGKEMFVSEHVSEPALPCAACKKDVPLPGKAQVSTTLTLRKTHQPAPDVSPEQNAARLEGNKPSAASPRTIESRSAKRLAWRARQKQKAALSSLHLTLSSILFVALAAGIIYLRFYYAPDLLKAYGLWIIAAAYLAIIIAAIKDNMFDALMCIVVPLYVFYYLFMVSSAMYLKAIVGAALIGFGYDFAGFAQVQAERAIDGVNTWIRTQ